MQDGAVQKLGVIGLGYIGLPTAATFAASGLEVVGVDVNQRVRDSVNAGIAHIEEGDLDTLVATVVGQGRLRACAEPVPCDAFIIAVPTPVSHDSVRLPDISYVESAARAIAPVLDPGNIVILESTSPVGTTDRVRDILAELRTDLRFSGLDPDPQIHIAYCPERIIPGRMLEELKSNDRIVGGMTNRCTELSVALYKRFVQGACIESDVRTAEMVKLTENAFRDVNIAFANELSMVCDALHLDVWEIIRLANRHPRVSILNPGAGVGGHCIAVDPWFIISSAPEQSRLMRTAREVNLHKTENIISQLSAMLDQDQDCKLGCFGLTYKADVDDFRESPALQIAHALTAKYPGRVLSSDPFSAALGELGSGLVVRDAESALAEVTAAAVLVAHTSFRSLVFPESMRLMDAVGLWK